MGKIELDGEDGGAGMSTIVIAAAAVLVAIICTYLVCVVW